MSYLNIRGKIIHCKGCSSTVTIEYDGGDRITQIGDENVMYQIELNNQFMPNYYNPDEEGYYFHDFANCRDCIEKEQENEDNYILVPDDYELFKYFNKVDEVIYDIGYLISYGCKDYLKALTVERLKGINEELFNKISSRKTFGIKKEKRRFSEEFVAESGKEIIRDYLGFISLNEELKDLIEEGVRCCSTYENEVINQIDYTGHIYRKIDYKRYDNLNDHIMASTTVRLGLGTDESVEFYEDPVKLNTKGLKSIIDNKNKFSMDSLVFQSEVESVKEDIIKKMVVIMTRMDFWV